MSAFQTDRIVSPLVAAGLVLALTAASADAAVFAKYDGVDGESRTVELSGFEIQPFGAEPQAGMLLPAIQAVREAGAADFARLACDGSVLPLLVIEVTKSGNRQPYLIYKLKDVIVTSYAMRGGLGRDVPIGGGAAAAPTEELTLGYTEIEWSYVESGETVTLDCSTGRCACAPSR